MALYFNPKGWDAQALIDVEDSFQLTQPGPKVNFLLMWCERGLYVSMCLYLAHLISKLYPDYF